MNTLFSPLVDLCLALPFGGRAALLAVVGLIIGSFLNVVIHRLPKMLDRQWRFQCAEFLAMPAPPTPTTYHLAWPASHCPHCEHPLTPLENIPLLSFLFLRGRCRACGASISWRYPLVEALAALGALVVTGHFGLTWQSGAALVFTWTLLAAAAIDLEQQILPDLLTLPLLWLGLALSVGEVFVTPVSAIIGALAGYLALWSVYWAFRLLTGKEGMGYGDFKLLAALGAWLGWEMLPLTVLLSSLVGALVGSAFVIGTGRDHRQPIPFGPFLAVAGWIALLWGPDLLHAYLNGSRFW